MPQGRREVGGVDVQDFREALSLPDGRALPQDVFHIGPRGSTVGTTRGVQAGILLVRGGPSSTRGNMTVDVARSLVHAGEHEPDEVPVNINES